MAVAQTRLAEDLYAEHSRRIYSYCLRRLRSREEAEDAVQATYLNACRSLLRGFEPQVAEAWLLKVAQNVCLTRLRSTSRRARVEWAHDVADLEDVLPAPPGAEHELFGLEEALATLPEQQRRAILLREWQGLSYREVAEELGLSQSAVEALLFRARRSLATALDAAEAPEPRRAAVHSFGVGGLLAGVKSLLAGNVSANVATAVAVAATATTLATVPLTATAVPEWEAKPVPKVQVDERAGLAAVPERTAAPVRPSVALTYGKPARGRSAEAHGKQAGKRRGLGRAHARGKGPGKHAPANGAPGGGTHPGKGPKKH